MKQQIMPDLQERDQRVMEQLGKMKVVVSVIEVEQLGLTCS